MAPALYYFVVFTYLGDSCKKVT